VKLVDAGAALSFAELQAARDAANRTEYSIAIDTKHRNTTAPTTPDRGQHLSLPNTQNGLLD
jgi:hypothetical protein